MFFRYTGSSRRLIFSRFFSFLFVLLAFSQLSVDAQEFYNDLDDTVYSSVWINTQQVDSINAHSGTYYSIADSAHPFGLGIESVFPEKYRGKNAILKVSGWVKSNGINDSAQYIISLVDDEKLVLWQNINLTTLLKESNYWYYFSDSVRVPASVTKYGKFKMYLWNNDLKDTIALDDLKVSFSEITMPSFVPVLNISVSKNLSNESDLLFSNPFYKIYYSSHNRTFQMYSIQDSLLVNNIKFFSERKRKGEKIISEQNLKLKSKNKTNNSSVLRFSVNSKLSRVLIDFICFGNSPEIKIDVKERYKSTQYISRESLVIGSHQPIKEIYRSNRKTDINDFQSEYWLGNEGVKFGNNKETVIAYHNPNVSSVQISSANNQLWINFDYAKDHPFLHFPLRNDTTDTFTDWSESKYKSGDQRHFSFSIFVGTNSKTLPRFMKNPLGYLATYIWTEHADFTNLRTNRATYFGSEKITKADKATGGFIKYRIPVTKSVFYTNPDSVTNSSVSNNMFNELESSIAEDPVYFDFLKQIWSKGVEICLHSPDNFTTNRKLLIEALSFMKKEFHSKSWIDHGYNNKLQNNREDMVCDGTLKNSPYYAMGFWENAGLKYFWNPYYEDNLTFEKWTFSQFIDLPYHGYGDRFPNPDFWKNPTQTGDLILWPTKSVMYMPNNWFWNYYFSEQVLNQFVDSWSVEINHCYPAWVDPEKGFWIYGNDSIIIAAPGFNQTLRMMSDFRDKKLLNVTTVEQFMDYQIALQNLNYHLLPDGRVKVTNKNLNPITGLSFATRARAVVVDGLKPFQKKVSDNLIFWFDLAPNESKIIRLIN